MDKFQQRHILGIEHLSASDIEFILDTAESLKSILDRPIKKVPTLRGRTVVMLFFEPSTRTKLSFDLAAKRLSADSVGITASASSIVKGETLIDTARNIEAMKPDVIVMRHPMSGAPHLMARHVDAAVINAGDGTNEHPSQALLDMMTIRERKGRIKGLQVAIIGDIAHSRVAKSDIRALVKMGARVRVAGPATMMPRCVETLGAEPYLHIEEAIRDADVVMTLRIQRERQGRGLFPSEREYAARFGINSKNFSLARDDALIMHPGPINRGIELTNELADSDRSVILDQVTNGVAVRMALFSLLLPELRPET
jgi:aspartate carbamoyltransferase catalytic subunit